MFNLVSYLVKSPQTCFKWFKYLSFQTITTETIIKCWIVTNIHCKLERNIAPVDLEPILSSPVCLTDLANTIIQDVEPILIKREEGRRSQDRVWQQEEGKRGTTQNNKGEIFLPSQPMQRFKWAVLCRISMNLSCQRRVRRNSPTRTTCWASSWWYSLTRASTGMDSSSLASKLAQATLMSPPRYLLNWVFSCFEHGTLYLNLFAGQVWNKSLPS